MASSPASVTSFSPTPVTLSLPAPSVSIALAFLMLTAVAPDVKRRFAKIIDLKMPTQEKILAFWNQVNDSLIYDVMVLSKMSIEARKTISLIPHIRPPNIGGNHC